MAGHDMEIDSGTGFIEVGPSAAIIEVEPSTANFEDLPTTTYPQPGTEPKVVLLVKKRSRVLRNIVNLQRRERSLIRKAPVEGQYQSKRRASPDLHTSPSGCGRCIGL
jgi:hypothetical protein